MRTFNARVSGPNQPSIDRNAAEARRLHYLKLADTQTAAGDRVAAESNFQHAKHYLRCATEGTP